VDVAPACAGSKEGSNHFVSYVCSISLHFCKRLFLGLEPMTSWSQGNSFTAAPRLPLNNNMKFERLFSICLVQVINFYREINYIQRHSILMHIITILEASFLRRKRRGKRKQYREDITKSAHRKETPPPPHTHTHYMVFYDWEGFFPIPSMHQLSKVTMNHFFVLNFIILKITVYRL
jgi:hypothetical protein